MSVRLDAATADGSSRSGAMWAALTAFIVYAVAYGDAMLNPFIINDDVRQQTFWMQKWTDPGLFQGDFLAEYARSYVPWGVQAINYVAARFVNPVQFSKVSACVLFVFTGTLMFRMGRRAGDELTGWCALAFFMLFGSFMRKISGGLSQSFVFPLLVWHLYYLGAGDLRRASIVTVAQSVFNPYVFVLCVVTQGLYVLYNHGKELVREAYESFREKSGVPPTLTRLVHIHKWLFVGVGLLLIGYAYPWYPQFGNPVTLADIEGKIEYTAAGRYEMLPVPSVWYELIRPWIFNLPFVDWGVVAGWVGALLLIFLVLLAIRSPRNMVNSSGFKVFLFLLPASFLMFYVAKHFAFKLFIPRRYIEYSLNILYCLTAAVCLRSVLERADTRRYSKLILCGLCIFAAIRLHNFGVYNYSEAAELYSFVEQNTPKTALLAGPPDLMDNIPTFAKRRAYVTYELSHAWIQPFWTEIARRTHTLYDMYYSADAAEINKVCRREGIDYLILRERDFTPEALRAGPGYFEPFNAYVKSITRDRTTFALMNEKLFPPLFRQNGIRVVRIPSPSADTRERVKGLHGEVSHSWESDLNGPRVICRASASLLEDTELTAPFPAAAGAIR